MFQMGKMYLLRSPVDGCVLWQVSPLAMQLTSGPFQTTDSHGVWARFVSQVRLAVAGRRGVLNRVAVMSLPKGSMLSFQHS